MEVLPLLELLAEFGKNLEGVVLPSSLGDEYEYRKPISALVNHERQVLEQIRAVIICDIRKLETVGFRGRFLDSATQQIYNELRHNRVPASWLALLRLNTGGPQKWSFDNFQKLLLDRLNTFAAWMEPDDGSYKLHLDKFEEPKHVFEVVHQHFVRNLVGNAMCYPDCLKVISLFEDSPKLTLPMKEDVIYLTGVRAMGHLQLQVIDTKGHLRRAPIAPYGVPVILQVTSSCLSDMRGISVSPKRPTSATLETSNDGDKTKAEPTNHSSGTREFLCPLFTLSGGSEFGKRAEASIRVVSALPIAQLVFSGASLELQTVE
ncbi:hypothetical protein PRIC1_009268 [Phytophthora ramorum]